MWDCVEQRQPWAISLVLCRLGRQRGYAEQPADKSPGGPGDSRPVIYLPQKDPPPEDLGADVSGPVRDHDSTADEDPTLDEVQRLMAHLQQLIGELEDTPHGAA